MRWIIDLVRNLGSVDFRVLLGRFLTFFSGIISTFVYYPRKKNLKIGQNNPKNRRTLGCARGLIDLVRNLKVSIFAISMILALNDLKGNEDSVLEEIFEEIALSDSQLYIDFLSVDSAKQKKNEKSPSQGDSKKQNVECFPPPSKKCEIETDPIPPCPFIPQVYINGCEGVRTPPGSPIAKGQHAIVSADFLYWTAREDGLEYNLLASSLAFDNVMENIEIGEPDFQWDPGMRLSLGVRGGPDHWELKSAWTQVFTSASQSAKTPPGMGDLNNGVWNDASGIVQTSTTTYTSAYWSIHYNFWDIGWSRSFFIGKNLAADLSFGGIGLWIHQKLAVQAPQSRPRSSQYALLPSGANLSMHFTNRYRAGGIFLRAQPQWNFLPGWSVLGCGSAYITRGTFAISQKWFVSELGSNDLSISKHLQRTRLGIQGSLGIQWQTNPMNDRWHMSLALQYEGLIWFKQNLWSQVSTIFAQNYERRGDLEMQGVSLSSRLDF